MTHELFLYSSDDEFVERLAAFLEAAVERGQGAVAITTPGRIERLRRSLGRRADSVEFFATTEWYRRPGAALVNLRNALDRHARDGVTFVCAAGEVPFGDDEDATQRWARYESVLNTLGSESVWVICPYNTVTLAPEIRTLAHRTHPFVSTRAGRIPNEAHYSADGVASPLAPAGDRSTAREYLHVAFSNHGELVDVRRRIRWKAHEAGLRADVVDDLLLAVEETTRQSVDHGHGATVRIARQNGEWFCDVTRPSGSEERAAAADDLGVQIGRVICDRVELAEDKTNTLVRFVFGNRLSDPRARIIAAASDLFQENGVRATGINSIISRAGVAKATFYAQFRSKEALIHVWLRAPVVRWFEQVRAEVELRADAPADRLTSFFEVLAEWLEEDDFRGCALINTATEFRGSENPFRAELADLMEEISEYLRVNAVEAGLPASIADELFLLVPGAITASVARASSEPARIARVAAARLIAASGG